MTEKKHTRRAFAAVIACLALTAAACVGIPENAETPAETPSETPSETPAETPKMTKQVTETPAETSAETPSETSAETPSETSAETPSETVTATDAVTASRSPEERARETAALTVDENGVDNAWAFLLINARNPLPDGYVPVTAPIGVYSLDARCAEYALLMFEAARNDGITLNVQSAYRSIERQTVNFESFYNSLVSRGYTPERAFDATAAEIAPPYTSEHNAGLAADIGIIESYFDTTEEFRWLKENSWKFGFIMRYPADKTSVTGIIYEPWHYRFVGLYHAGRIRDSGLCLEEYMGDDGSDNDVNGVVEKFREYITGR
ncbi:MAG: D-alanyl-D-alanine carboxypeptidase family protein [Oscillospiraceae bacterium]|jgi:D-alanyl-D-alanine carboxypeptidase|nr:D-alanyl-D-alanine carboxypeptidase family protein [Oscillospiraceae bacterium]